jgi:hypothetical protein
VNVQPPNRPFVPTVQALGEPIIPKYGPEKVIDTPGVNPPPDPVTDTPLGPRLGVSVSSGEVIVKTSLDESNAPSDPVAVMV